MDGSNFYNNLTNYVKKQDNDNANRVIMVELGNLLVKDKPNFIEVIRGANISVPDNATDIQLVNAFVDNAPSNRKLLLGASFLINHKNKMVGFDGKEKVSDTGVKATYKVMYQYFEATNFEDTSDIVNDDYYGATGEDYSYIAPLVAGAFKGGLDLANKFIPNKNASSDALAKQQEARRQMTQTILAQRQQQADEKAKEKERKHKSQKTLLIVGGAILGLAIIGGIIYAIKKGKK